MPRRVTTSISERALLLLEIIANADGPLSLNELMAVAGLPKATAHRFVTLLEELGFVRRTLNTKRYEVGHRLTSLAVRVMGHSLRSAPRRAILTALVNEVGETCNLNMVDGLQMIYLDRVESDWPLQYRLEIGSHVPLHCTASGKLFLSLAPASLRQMLYRSGPLERYTPRTITNPAELEIALEKIRKTGVGTDNEEFIEGMTATSVPVRDSKGKICAAVAVHGPISRLPFSRALAVVPALKKAASAIEKTFLPAPALPAKKRRKA